MAITSIDVDDVCDEATLANEVGGLEALKSLLPDGWADSSVPRQRALERIILALRRRTPPILDVDLANVEELRDAVIYGALEHIYSTAVTSGGEDSVFEKKRKHFEDRWEDEIAGLNPTLSGDVRGATQSFSHERR